MAESPHFLGMGPQAAYSVVFTEPRQDAAREAVAQLLGVVGLAGSVDDATYRLDVAIYRNRFFIHQTAARFRLRSEVFLLFTFRRGEEVAGRVLACGNAQARAQIASKKKVTAVYQASFDDAFSYKVRDDNLCNSSSGMNVC